MLTSGKSIPIYEGVRYDRYDYLDIKKKIQDIDRNILLISEIEKRYIVNRLVWECKNVRGVIYTNTDNPHIIEKNVSRGEKLVWNMQAKKSENQSDMSGWVNSYNYEKLKYEEIMEYCDNNKEKLLPYITVDTSMLEIGVGSGLQAFNLAPLCKRYDGCDISDIVLEKLKENAEKNNITNISLYNCAANEIERIGEKYDIIFMSSVTQYFSGYSYMREVVDKCIQSVKEKGVILFADIYDLDRKKDFIQSVNIYVNEHEGCKHKKDFSHELYIPREFWRDMANSFEEISKLIISDKIGTINNEINTYRYDVLFEIDKTKKEDQKELTKRKLYKYMFGTSI